MRFDISALGWQRSEGSVGFYKERETVEDKCNLEIHGMEVCLGPLCGAGNGISTSNCDYL